MRKIHVLTDHSESNCSNVMVLMYDKGLGMCQKQVIDLKEGLSDIDRKPRKILTKPIIGTHHFLAGFIMVL